MNRNIKLFYLISAFQAMWFVEPVWYFYWHRFASYTSIGILFSLISIVALVVELPTGIIADKFGRKLSTIIGTFLFALSCWLIALGPSFLWLSIGLVLQTIGRAFISGALEALMYDSLKAEGQEATYDQVISRKAQLQMACFAIAVFIGGFLYQFHFRLPHLIMALSLTISWISSLWLHEPPRTKSLENPLKEALIGTKQLLNPDLRPFLLSIIAITIAFLLYDWGFLKPAMSVHFNMFSQEQGVAYALMAIINTVLIGLVPLMRKRLSDSNGLRLLNLLVAAGFLLALFPLGWWGIFALFLIEAGGFLAEPWISVIINRHIASQYRATTLSAVQLIGRLPYIIINLIAGKLIDLGQTWYVFLWIGVGLIAVQIIGLVMKQIYLHSPQYLLKS